MTGREKLRVQPGFRAKTQDGKQSSLVREQSGILTEVRHDEAGLSQERAAEAHYSRVISEHTFPFGVCLRENDSLTSKFSHPFSVCEDHNCGKITLHSASAQHCL